MTTLYQYALSNIEVIDGDTISADIDLGFAVILKNRKTRLAHIDCPEVKTPEGIKARDFTSQWIESSIKSGKPIVVSVKNHRLDKYGRILGVVTCDGQSLADALKLAGYGVAYEGGTKPIA
mgnify:FL=1